MTLVWLLCTAATHGKTLIRKGWKEGLPADVKEWVFCPLLRRGRFPRDRVPTTACEKCSNYKGTRLAGLRFFTREHENTWKPAVREKTKGKGPKSTIDVNKLADLSEEERDKLKEEHLER